MRIANREELLAQAAEGLQDARSDMLAILERALDAVEPGMLVGRALHRKQRELIVRGDPFAGGPGSAEDLRLDLGPGALRCVAAGKASAAMLGALQAEPEDAFAVAPQAGRAGAWEVLEGGHPLPTQGSCKAGARALELARATGEGDTLLVLLSGGASALLEEPLVPLEDLRTLTQAMLRAGATIEELNVVRKKLSGLKGGRLAEAAKGQVVTLILSDVFEDHAGIAGSGPTAPDATTHGDALAVLEDVGVEAPPSVLGLLREGKQGQRPETPKPASAAFKRTHNVVLGSNALACHEATELAIELGYNAFRVREPLRGPAARAGWKLARMADDITLGRAALPRPACIVHGGETVVDVRGATGKGGRNQEAALAALDTLKCEAVLGFLATDGVDGPTDAAGALLDMGSKERAEDLGLDARDHLQRHASYDYFQRLGGLLRTGPTGTNVADVAVLLVP